MTKRVERGQPVPPFGMERAISLRSHTACAARCGSRLFPGEMKVIDRWLGQARLLQVADCSKARGRSYRCLVGCPGDVRRREQWCARGLALSTVPICFPNSPGTSRRAAVINGHAHARCNARRRCCKDGQGGDHQSPGSFQARAQRVRSHARCQQADSHRRETDRNLSLTASEWFPKFSTCQAGGGGSSCRHPNVE